MPTPAVAVSERQSELHDLIGAALGDGWAMDDPADKAAAVEAVLQVVAAQQSRITAELEARFAESAQLARII